ncbi:hypothetical protein HFO61_30180, partial [Rhizobium leguminosarum]|uniref:hypothetical protein n=1 Tax=Rhizobium leguminosarum TaxID=384 RepID=UPI001C93FCAD
MNNNKKFGKAYRIDPNPHSTELCERIPVGFKLGNVPHGGFEILDGEASDYASANAVLEEQAEIISIIAPFVDMDIYWGPSFRVWQHGEVITSQQHVQLFTPYNEAKTIYKRRPCILISTQALDQRVEAKPINAADPPKRDPYLEEAKRVACEIAYQVVEQELYRHAHEEFFYGLAEGTGRPRMQSWEAAKKFLDDRWLGFLNVWLSLTGVRKEETEIGGKDLAKFHRAVFNGSMGRHLSR